MTQQDMEMYTGNVVSCIDVLEKFGIELGFGTLGEVATEYLNGRLNKRILERRYKVTTTRAQFIMNVLPSRASLLEIL